MFFNTNQVLYWVLKIQLIIGFIFLGISNLPNQSLRELPKDNSEIVYNSLKVQNLVDTDDDGVPDVQDLDDDNDGILDKDETIPKKLKFSYTQEDQLFTVPYGVSQLKFKIWGAGGGGSNAGYPYSTGGAGGFVSGFLEVQPGQEYKIMVGQGGMSDNSSDPNVEVYGFGGSPPGSNRGSHGGGLSGIFKGKDAILPTSQTRALLIAGGGGAGERAPVLVSSGGQGGDPSHSGGMPTMAGGNDLNGYGGGGGGGYYGGVSGENRISNYPDRVHHGEGGSNYLEPSVLTPIFLSSTDIANLSDPFQIQENLPPNITDPDYEVGIGTGTTLTGNRGGNGLVILEYFIEIDTDNDGLPDHLDLDSDGDGCSDANEAYGDANADNGDGYIFGTDLPTLDNGGVNSQGLVVAAGVNTSNGLYINTIQSINGINTFQSGLSVLIEENPNNQTSVSGNSVTFSARTILDIGQNPSGDSSLTYQWQVSVDDGTTFSNIVNQSGTVDIGEDVYLTLDGLTEDMDGYLFRVIFSHPFNLCQVISSNAELSIVEAIPSFSLLKTGVFTDSNGDGFAQPGEVINYTFTVINTGNLTISNINIEDELLGGDICIINALAPQESSTACSIDYVITQNDIDNGEVINQAKATGNTGINTEVFDLSDDPLNPQEVDSNNDGESDDPTIITISRRNENIEIYNALTPNGDGLNDYFKIEGISSYPQNNVKIFNRWGVLVWENNGYDENNNVFKGVSNGRAILAKDKKLPSGTYYYLITLIDRVFNDGKKSYTGYLYINN